MSLPIEAGLFISKIEERGSWSWLEVGQLIEITGGHLAKMTRLTCEMTCPREREYLAMTDEERAKATRPVYEWVGEGDSQQIVHVGDRPVDKAECEKNLSQATSVACTAEVVEHVAALHLPTTIAFAGIVVTALFVQDHQRAHRANRDREIGLVFAERETIPEEFEDDDVLGLYICPITRCPIRYAVLDPTTNTMFERAAIEAWIDANHSSPASRRPLERADLVPATETQVLIDNRLQHLQEEREAVGRYIHEMIAARQQEPAVERPPVVGGVLSEHLHVEAPVHERDVEESVEHPSLLPQEQPDVNALRLRYYQRLNSSEGVPQLDEERR